MSTEAILSQIDDALEDWRVGPDAMRCGAPPGSRGLIPYPHITPAQLSAMSVRLVAMFEPFKEAMAKVATAAHACAVALGLEPPRDRHHGGGASERQLGCQVG
jgi:hypothetical protein